MWFVLRSLRERRRCKRIPVSTPEPASERSGLNAKPALGRHVSCILAFIYKLAVISVTDTFYFHYVVICTLGFNLLWWNQAQFGGLGMCVH